MKYSGSFHVISWQLLSNYFSHACKEPVSVRDLFCVFYRCLICYQDMQSSTAVTPPHNSLKAGQYTF